MMHIEFRLCYKAKWNEYYPVARSLTFELDVCFPQRMLGTNDREPKVNELFSNVQSMHLTSEAVARAINHVNEKHSKTRSYQVNLRIRVKFIYSHGMKGS